MFATAIEHPFTASIPLNKSIAKSTDVKTEQITKPELKLSNPVKKSVTRENNAATN